MRYLDRFALVVNEKPEFLFVMRNMGQVFFNACDNALKGLAGWGEGGLRRMIPVLIDNLCENA